jgi:UrcA family protein
LDRSAQTEADAPKAAVSFADLDLSRAGGRTVLEHRVETAIDQVCPGRPLPGELRNLQLGHKCREQAWANARRQLAAIYDGRAFAEAAIQVGPGKR